MKERRIIFKDEMIRAILDVRKTQTRRLVKSPRGYPQYSHCDPFVMPPAVWWWNGKHQRVGVRQECPFGQLGDQMWVGEKWHGPCQWGEFHGKFIYRADKPSEWPTNIRPPNVAAWKPSINMPRFISRITLEITGVRVERLQKINDADAIAEGVEGHYIEDDWYWRNYLLTDEDAAVLPMLTCPKESFCSLWESTYGKASWEANPWVWVIEFKRVQP